MKNTLAVKGGSFNADAPLQIGSVKVKWLPDMEPDLSWLDQTDVDMGEGFEANSKERKASYGSSWEMLGCVATAEVSYPIGGGSRRIQRFTSGGLWGIESDSDKSYMAEVEAEQLADLAQHLSAFGIEATAESLKEMAAE